VRILLIEDYEPLRTSLAKGLREAGLAVDDTGDGEEGLWYARSADYDVVVLDLMLPKVGGLEILETIRREGRDTHVLILTARDTPEDRVRGLNTGADDYLVKPFSFAELLARIQALLRRRYGHKQPVLTVGDLEVDTIQRQVARAGRQIPLTAREYALLEYLARRAGQPVSRTEIWEHVYEFNDEAQSNVVDVYIGYLRRKLDLPGCTPLIHTRRGQGYVLGAQA
jgi:DNA-binding response OmpR family regulator